MIAQQEISPTNLKSTESILTSLYERINRSASDKAKKEKLQFSIEDRHKQESPVKNMNEFAIKPRPCIETGILRTEQSYQTRWKKKSLNQEDHQHSQCCCILVNKDVQRQVAKSKELGFLLQSYQEQVQYLKRVNMMQSQQIQKLRRRLRIESKNRNFNELNFDSFVQTEKVKDFMQSTPKRKCKKGTALKNQTKQLKSISAFKNKPKQKHSFS